MTTHTLNFWLFFMPNIFKYKTLLSRHYLSFIPSNLNNYGLL